VSNFIDLSHPVEVGMETYRPLPTPQVVVHNDYDASRYNGESEFLIASLHLCGNTGTYVDSPKHRYREARPFRSARTWSRPEGSEGAAPASP
jgi:arylformamidase